MSRIAVVTGAAGYIGQGITRQLLKQGRKVAMVDVDIEALAAAAQLFEGEEVLQVPVDLKLKDAPDRIVDAISAHGWALPTILVNNAGITARHDGGSHNVVKMALEEWDSVFWINLTMPMLLAKKMIPYMVAENWGRVVNISSRAGKYNPNQAGPAYATSKAALLGLTRSIANDFPLNGITCNSIAPGIFRSKLTDSVAPEIMESIVAKTPIGRAGNPDELGSAVAYFTSDEASFATGTCLDVNGGHTMS